MVLPIIKLGSLFVRTISKPIANRLKLAAAYHPTFRGLIIDLAQGYHRIATTMERHAILGSSSSLEIRPLNEERAVQSATDLLGELFVFTVAGSAILYEVQRSTRAEANKEERRKQELEAMKQKNAVLAAELKLMKQRLEQVELAARDRTMFRFWKLREYENPNFRNFKHTKESIMYHDVRN